MKIRALTDARGLPIKLSIKRGQTHDTLEARDPLRDIGDG